MATLRDIQRRIRSVQSTQKITRAMKLVAAAKLRRAQERILSARPYANKMAELLGNLVSGSDDLPDQSGIARRLRAGDEERGVDLVPSEDFQDLRCPPRVGSFGEGERHRARWHRPHGGFARVDHRPVVESRWRNELPAAARRARGTGAAEEHVEAEQSADREQDQAEQQPVGSRGSGFRGSGQGVSESADGFGGGGQWGSRGGGVEHRGGQQQGEAGKHEAGQHDEAPHRAAPSAAAVDEHRVRRVVVPLELSVGGQADGFRSPVARGIGALGAHQDRARAAPVPARTC